MSTIKNFLFTSLGDNTNFDNLWIGNNMNYEIFAIYYGDNEDIFNKYKSKIKFLEKRKGSKFQNFKYFYDNYNNILDNYDRFFILDDDIIINVNDINKMFELSRKYNLKICAPSFLSSGKISHRITKQKQNTLLTYTNFVEVNTPLFNREALDKLMKVLDPSLIGWGIDFLYIWANGVNDNSSYAIIHSIGVINPNDQNKKNKTRELTKIDNCNIRDKIWYTYADKINCPRFFYGKEYKSIPINKN